jgi:hypothetical protein
VILGREGNCKDFGVVGDVFDLRDLERTELFGRKGDKLRDGEERKTDRHTYR